MSIWGCLEKNLASFIARVIRFCERIDDERRYSLLLSTFSSVGNNCRFQFKDYVVHGQHNIKIGDNFYVGRCFRLEALELYNKRYFSPEIVIGNNVRIEDYCHIGCVERVIIGDGVLIASKVFITDHFHGVVSAEDFIDMPKERPLKSKPVVIGKNVWIGESVSIMPGVTLGDNVIVGANTVVTHSFPANVVIAGCPAKVIKALA